MLIRICIQYDLYNNLITPGTRIGKELFFEFENNKTNKYFNANCLSKSIGQRLEKLFNFFNVCFVVCAMCSNQK